MGNIIKTREITPGQVAHPNPVGSTSNFSNDMILTGIFTPDFDPVLFGKNSLKLNPKKWVSLARSSQTSKKSLGKTNVFTPENQVSFRFASQTPEKSLGKNVPNREKNGESFVRASRSLYTKQGDDRELANSDTPGGDDL